MDACFHLALQHLLPVKESLQSCHSITSLRTRALHLDVGIAHLQPDLMVLALFVVVFFLYGLAHFLMMYCEARYLAPVCRVRYVALDADHSS